MLIDRREWLLARALQRRRSGKIFLEQNSWYEISKIFSVLFTRNALARYFAPRSPVGGIGEVGMEGMKGQAERCPWKMAKKVPAGKIR